MTQNSPRRPQKKAFKAAFTGDETGKIKLKTKEETDAILARLQDAEYSVSSVKKRNAQTFSGTAVYNLHHAAGRLQKARISG